MRVSISTIGTFWSFDLARQLHERQALAAVFSGYPWFRLKREGIPKKYVHRFPYLHVPWLKLSSVLGNTNLLRDLEWYDRVLFDRYVARNLVHCDIFCGLSGCSLASGRIAKLRGAQYVCDRGSSHIRYQDRILREEYDRIGIKYEGIDRRMLDQEELEYELADVITVPSQFAWETFVTCGVDPRKVKVVPYGVNLSRFFADRPRDESIFNVLFVGTVSVRKGIAYLIEAFRRLQHPRKRLILAGPISSELRERFEGELSSNDIELTGSVSQSHVRHLMSSSHVLVLPSIEDGFGLVLAQAMACGCPVIASVNTGGPDLFKDGGGGFLVPIRNSEIIADYLQQLASSPELRSRMTLEALNCVRLAGGWTRYGETIYQVFSKALQT